MSLDSDPYDGRMSMVSGSKYPNEETVLQTSGALESLLQHHSSKASNLQLSAFVTVQLSHPYMTAGKTIALTRRTLVGRGLLYH